MKFYTNKKVITIKGNQMVSRWCTCTYLNRRNTLWIDQTSHLKEKVKVWIKVVEDLKESSLISNKSVITKIRYTLDPRQEKTLIKLFNT
jgi:hypothetical protein